MAIINGTPLNDRLNGTAGDDTIFGLEGDDVLIGNDGNDLLGGGAGRDQLFGGNGADVLDGGTGADKMAGGLGNDDYYVDHVGDVAAEGLDGLAGGFDGVFASVTHTLGFGIENLKLTGSAAINGTGNALNNTIIGNDASNILSGLAGDDQLHGGGGADVLNGGTGADKMAGGLGNDDYYVDHVGDVAAEGLDGLAGGFDGVFASVTHTLGFGIENLKLTGSAAINGTGNALNNTIIGNDASNILSGLAGDDQLHGGGGADVLNGGTGADKMAGGLGNDDYYVDHVGDVVAEGLDGLAGGFDGVFASVTHTLGFGIENLKLTGSAAINGTGNALNNTIIGNSANNILPGLNGNDVLTGGAGNDTLLGGNGNDVLTGGSGRDLLNGGAGNDRFDYNAVSESPTSTGRDVITGFAGAGTALGDQIDLRDIDANTLVSGNQAFTWRGATPGGTGTLWYTGGVLYGNVDGDATPEFQIQLVGSPALVVGGTGTDILL